MASWPGTKMVSRRGNYLMLLSLQGPFDFWMACPCGPPISRLAPDVWSFKSLYLVAIDGDSSGHELKLWIKSHKLGTKALARNEKTTCFALTMSFPW